MLVLANWWTALFYHDYRRQLVPKSPLKRVNSKMPDNTLLNEPLKLMEMFIFIVEMWLSIILVIYNLWEWGKKVNLYASWSRGITLWMSRSQLVLHSTCQLLGLCVWRVYVCRATCVSGPWSTKQALTIHKTVVKHINATGGLLKWYTTTFQIAVWFLHVKTKHITNSINF